MIEYVKPKARFSTKRHKEGAKSFDQMTKVSY